MANYQQAVLNLSDAHNLGLSSRHVSVDEEIVVRSTTLNGQNRQCSIHYVASPNWENQSSGCILLHGGSGDWRHYAMNFHAIVPQVACVAPVLPGFGGSSKVVEDTLEAIAVPIVNLVQSIPWEKTTLVGFSFGALVAAEVALHCNVDRLMLISPAGFGDHSPEMMAMRTQAADIARREGLQAGLKFNLERIMLHRVKYEQQESLLLLMEEMLLATKAKVRKFSRRELLVDRLKSYSGQLRVLFGEQDPYHKSMLASRIDAIREAHLAAQIYTIADAGHWLMFDHPQAFEQALLNFCRHELEVQ